jgi:hypothetical protein
VVKRWPARAGPGAGLLRSTRQGGLGGRKPLCCRWRRASAPLLRRTRSCRQRRGRLVRALRRPGQARGRRLAERQPRCCLVGRRPRRPHRTKGQFEGVLAPDPDRQAPAALRLQEHDDMVVLAVVSDAADVADPHVEEVSVGGGWHDVLLRTTRRERRGWSPDATGAKVGEGEAGTPVPVVALPPQAAARRPALGGENVGMLLVDHVPGATSAASSTARYPRVAGPAAPVDQRRACRRRVGASRRFGATFGRDHTVSRPNTNGTRTTSVPWRRP